MPKGKGKTKQSSLQTAGLLPTLKKPAEAIGLSAHVLAPRVRYGV